METSIRDSFPELSAGQLDLLARLEELLREWNEKINLVSRRDMPHLRERHIMHSLAAAKAVSFPGGARVLDAGTGGGLPGLPLAVRFPEARFTLADSAGKKIRAAEDMAERLGLKNVTFTQARLEKLPGPYDFVLGRAVAPLPVFIPWIRGCLRSGGPPERPRGVLYYKGSHYAGELQALKLKPFRVFPLADYFTGDFFREKYLLYLRAGDVIKKRRGRRTHGA